jgi:signal transduction histidine kinase
VTWPSSLKARLTLAFSLIALAGVGGFATALAFLVERAVWAPLDGGLAEEATTLGTLVDLPPDRLAEIVREIGLEGDLGPGKFIRVAGRDGRTRVRHGRVPPAVGRKRPRPLRALTVASVGRDASTLRVAWTPTPDGGWAMVGVRAVGPSRLVRQARIAIGVVAAGLLALLVVTAWAIAARATRELARVAQDLETIEAGSLDRRLEAGHTAEVNRLVAVLNRMLGRLGSAVGALRRFTADAAHELRTPLAALRAHLEVALARRPSAEEARDTLLDALEQTERLARLAEDLLTLSVVEGTRPGKSAAVGPLRLDVVALEVAQSLQPLAEEQGRSFVVEAPDPVWVRGAASLIRRAVLNLVDNAFRHTAPAAEVRVSVVATAAAARLVVSDRGRGIAAEDLPHVFERFRPGRSEARGTGLGLALVREIITWHGGSVTLENGTGGGTTVILDLPLAPSGAEPPLKPD